jgi:4-nitrophenyl phosphatase
MTWVLDLDGVVWLAGHAIPGSASAVERLRKRGDQVAFLTNNSGPTLAEYVAMLGAAGVGADPSELVTSAQAAASLLDPGSSAAMIGGDGLAEALVARGVRVVAASEQPDAVVVGRALDLEYSELAAAASAVRAGARLVATNTDATFPTPDGLLPGAGAVVAFVEVAAGRRAEAAGKPNPPVANLVRARWGVPTVVVGDRPDTDGRFARLVGAPFALVLTGVTSAHDLPVAPAPDAVGADLAEIVDTFRP